MKIVSWNCNLKLCEKFDLLTEIQPDIAVVQECEKLPSDYFPGANYVWVGHNTSKGLGVLSFVGKAKIHPSYNPKFAHFMPFMSPIGNILAVWAFNHRASKAIGPEAIGEPGRAFHYYQRFLRHSEMLAVAGDFNNSIVWDKKNGRNNFSSISTSLERLGYRSSYHSYTGECLGKETSATLFHTKNEKRPFHIDYVYSPYRPLHIDIGRPEKWLQYSDHMPLQAELVL